MQIHKRLRTNLFVCLILSMNTITIFFAVLENIYGIYSYSKKIMANNIFSQTQSDNASYANSSRLSYSTNKTLKLPL